VISPAAFKYSQAFLNVYVKNISHADVKHMEKAYSFLVTHKRALFFLRVPLIEDGIKLKNIRAFCERFRLPDACIALFKLLLAQKKGYMLADVLLAIVKLYKRAHGITSLIVSSSCALKKGEKREVEQFAETKFPGTKEYTYVIDPALIAGVKISSETLLWESSIQQYLRDCASAQIW
jgi:F0F1-type ATP synthase delta subunit